VSKRHQASRRKTYGRRQHELHERSQRRHDPNGIAFDLDPFAAEPASGDLPFLDVNLRGSRLRFALGD